MAVTLSSYSLLNELNPCTLFSFTGKLCVFHAGLKDQFKSFQIKLSKILPSCLWDMFGGKFLIILRISSFQKSIVFSKQIKSFFFVFFFCSLFFFFFVVLFVLIENVLGAQLFLTKGQYSVKNVLNIFACFFFEINGKFIVLY